MLSVAMKKLILILVVLLALGGGGGGAWWFFFRAAPDAGPAEASNAPLFYALPAFTVSIVRDRRSYGMITVELALELKDEATRAAADAQLPRLSDRIYVALYDLLGRRVMAERHFDLDLIKGRLIRAAEGALGEGSVTGLMYQSVENRFIDAPAS